MNPDKFEQIRKNGHTKEETIQRCKRFFDKYAFPGGITNIETLLKASDEAFEIYIFGHPECEQECDAPGWYLVQLRKDNKEKFNLKSDYKTPEFNRFEDYFGETYSIREFNNIWFDID